MFCFANPGDGVRLSRYNDTCHSRHRPDISFSPGSPSCHPTQPDNTRQPHSSGTVLPKLSHARATSAQAGPSLLMHEGQHSANLPTTSCLPFADMSPPYHAKMVCGNQSMRFLSAPCKLPDNRFPILRNPVSPKVLSLHISIQRLREVAARPQFWPPEKRRQPPSLGELRD